MNLFGFTITRSAPAPAPAQRSFSPEIAAWLAGEQTSPAPTLHNAYQQSVWVYRAINVLAEQVANVPFLFSAGQRGRENLITSGPLLHFYNRPHRSVNRFQYWELRVLWLMLRGECCRLPIYDSSPSPFGKPKIENQKSKLKSVLFLDPDRLQHVIDNHQLVGWRYNDPDPRSPIGSQVFLPEEIWFEKLPNPFDFWRGLSPLLVADLASKTDFASSSFMRGFIENNAENGLIVRTDPQLSPEQHEQIAAALRRRKHRAGSADSSIVLWGATEIVHPRLSSADLQFLENRKFSRSEICAAFGVPEEIVTTTDHNKYDVMQGARLNFIENRVAPLCARLEAEEQATVSSIDPNAVGWFDLESLPIMEQARRNRIATAKLGFDMGIPFNELNRVLDLGFSPLPWGNSGFVPAQLQKLGEAPPPPLPPRASTAPIAQPAVNSLDSFPAAVERALELLRRDSQSKIENQNPKIPAAPSTVNPLDNFPAVAERALELLKRGGPQSVTAPMDQAKKAP